MIDRVRRVTRSKELFTLTEFGPIKEVEQVLRNAPQEKLGTYLNDEFRSLLERYGVDYDLPPGLRPVRRVLRKTLLRRAVFQVDQDSTRARFLIIDTDSLLKNVTPESVPHDPNTADLFVWPMLMKKKVPSNTPWGVYVGDIPHPEPHRTPFLVSLTRLGNNGYVRTHLKGHTRGFPYFKEDMRVGPIDLLNNWIGL